MKNSREQAAAAKDSSAGQQSQLDPVAGPVLDWLPGETLYSLLSRNHYYRGHQDPAETLYAFFGGRSGQSLQDDLNELDVFVQKTGGRLGTVEQILEERTLFRFYRLFMPQQKTRLLDGRFKTADSMLKFPLGVRTGRFRTTHPLKACCICLANDFSGSRTGYWRLEHQFPGVWVCLEHNFPLREVRLKPAPSQKVIWQTPFERGMNKAPEALMTTENFKRFRTLAELVVSISADCEQGRTRLSGIRQRFCQRLQEQGLLLPSGRLKSTYLSKVASICKEYIEFAAVFKLLPAFEVLPNDMDLAFRQLARYVNGTSVVTPLERVIISAWLEDCERVAEEIEKL